MSSDNAEKLSNLETAKLTCKTCMKTNALTIASMLAVVVGIIIGCVFKSVSKTTATPRVIMYINYPGELFLQMLKCLIIPLIVGSLISAIGSIDLRISKKIGCRAIIYYLSTTFLAIFWGIILVTTIRPGKTGVSKNTKSVATEANLSTVDTLLDLVRSLFPPNIVEACIQQFRTKLVPPAKPDNNTNTTNTTSTKDWKISRERVPGTNILGLVVFSVAFAIAISTTNRKDAKPLLRFFQSLCVIVMTITRWVIIISPIGIISLVASKIVEMESLAVMMSTLGAYMGTVLVGLVVHGFITLPMIFLIITRRSPIRYILNMGDAIAIAFGTASSAATLPIAINCLETKNKIDPRVTRFVMPIGATVNMDGTALYEAIAALFIAQLRKVHYGFGQVIAVSITATAASIGAAGIPQAGLVTMVMVLDTLGLPASDVGLILAVDWFLDRCRTVINVLGDSLGAGIVHHCSRDDLESVQVTPTSYQDIRRSLLDNFES